MKQKIIIKIYIVFLLVVSGCTESFFDFKPSDRYTEGNFWVTESSAERYLNGCYAILRTGGLYGGDATPLWEETVTPNAYNKDNSGSWNSIARGMQTSETGGIIKSRWSQCYGGIGRCNSLLARIDQVPMDEELRERMKGEALFLRALYYFNLQVYWGDIPFILDPPNPATQVNLPRIDRGIIIDQIINDLDEASSKLPWKYDQKNLGRVTKGASMALKAKVLLFEASPLFNPENDLDKWILAADAAKQVIDSESETGYDLFPNYRELFLPENENNQEVIFDVQFIFPDLGNSFDLINRQYNNNAPLQDLVNAYQMKTGKNINEEDSGYDPTEPYKDRDPRMNATIVYPGARFMGKIVTDNQFAITGFGFKKYSIYDEVAPDPKLADLKAGQSYTNYMVLRYADILLMFAEAQNEVNGPDVSVLEALNRVRYRAGMPDIADNLTKEEMREIIRHERRIEFAGEGYYYNDIRRWKQAEYVLNGPILNLNGAIIETRAFNPDRDYWWPINVEELDLNEALRNNQNPGY